MQTDDIARAEARYEEAHAKTKRVLLAQDPNEPDAHQSELNEAIGGVEAMITFFDGKVREFQTLRDAAKDKKRNLERDFEDAKRAYWRLRDEAKRNRVEGPSKPF